MELKPIHGRIDSVIDQRKMESHVIGEYEVTKYLFVPVDLVICTKRPLADEMAEILDYTENKEKPLRFKLVLDDFWLRKKTDSWLYPHYQLNASIQLHSQNGNDAFECIGHFVYQTVSRKPLFGEKLKTGFEKIMVKWHEKFVYDLSTVTDDLCSHRAIALRNFHQDYFLGRRIYLYSGMDAVITPREWITDGAIFFSYREARKRFFRSGGYNLRYRSAKTFESIEFGLSTDYLFYRLNRRMVLRGKSQIMLGFNRWKDIDTKDHTLYDILIVDTSLSQSLLFDPLYKRSFLIGIGLFENLYYVYSKGIQFQFGLLFHLGLKL